MGIADMLLRGLDTMIDAILPRRARNVRLHNYTTEDIPVNPRAREVGGRHITTLLDYRELVVEDLIRSLKYDGSMRAAGLCASVLAEYLREEIAAARPFLAREIILVPIPLHPSRARERGFNQIELILKRLPQEFHDGTLSEICFDLLVRTRATPQQTRLPRIERLKNVADAFRVRDAERARGAHLFVIDDVTTTGATLVNAAEPLEALGAAVTLLALARA